jgi:type IV fimbrial biogenesis protein FimT
MIELLITVAIVGVLAAIAAPALSSWVQNAQIRTTADAIQNGLQLARGEAVRRNSDVRFQLTTTTDNSCALSTTNSNWVVSTVSGVGSGDPTGACATPPSDANAPYIIQVRPSAEGSGSSVDSAGQSLICFNGLGKQSTNAACNPPGTVTISVKNPTGGACLEAGGPMKCMNVVVSSAGQIRMCDRSLSQATNPQGC